RQVGTGLLHLPGPPPPRSNASAQSWRPRFVRLRSTTACVPSACVQPVRRPRNLPPFRKRVRNAGRGPSKAQPSRRTHSVRSRILPSTNDARLILLGTKGGPRVGKGRANPANVVVVNGHPYVIDCGYGVTRQLVDAGIEADEVRTILITHNHSDHMLELGPLI